MAAEGSLTFAEHIQELRKRLMWSLLFVAIGAGIGYLLHDTLLQVLQRPLDDTLYYTNPTGAFSFIIKVCTVFGVIVALPMALYQGFAFFEPLIGVKTRRLMIQFVLISVLLAGAGIAFAYFVSLPAALHFLVNFGGNGIESLITANEYFNFVLAYIAGFAVLFQLPLIILFINRVTPLTPGKLMGGTRYIVLGSFIVAAVITPTPDPFNQALMAGPIILLYFLSALMVAVMNRKSSRQKQQIAPQPYSLPELVPIPKALPMQPMVRAPAANRPQPSRRLVTDMVVSGKKTTAHYTPRPVHPAPLLEPSPPHTAMHLISDFVPASK